MAYLLPPPLIAEILSRLPVKSLVRFRCVSKPWKSIIDGPNFNKLHLKNSLENTTNFTIILRDSKLYFVDFPTLKRVTEITHPLKCDHYGTEVVGSCNGLICLSNGEESGLNGTIIYNPATKKHRVLPVSPIEYPEDEFLPYAERLVYGFGYDRFHDDYKLVRIIQFYGSDPDNYDDSEVKVYSLKANSWKRVKNFPREYFITYKRAWGVHVNGCLHWMVTKNPESNGSRLIMAFDLGSERCKVVPKPRELCGECPTNVEVLQGRLGLLCNYYSIRTDFWTMEQYGVEGSWTKLYSIAQRTILGVFEYVRPIACSKDGSCVLLHKDMNSMFWFDLRTQRAKRVNIRGMPKSFEAMMLVESLVPLDGSKKKKNKPKKKRIEHSEQADSRIATLPLLLLQDIFSRLPADTLLKLTYVCKPWNHIVHDPEFAKMHLKFSGRSNDNLYFILREHGLHVIKFNLLNKAVEIKHPLVCPEGWTDILGSCNGLLCLYNQDKDLAIWNPLTGRCHKLPITNFQSPKDFDGFHHFIHGFGFDPKSDDYKVVRVLQFYWYYLPSHGCLYNEFSDSEDDTFAGSEVQVYSLKTKSWRRIECFPFILCYPCSGVLANGALHWVARKRHNVDSTSYIILAFDLRSEKCRVVPQPNYDDINFHMSLFLLGGSLCILCHCPRHGVDIWVMKNYELQSWCRLISITQPKPIEFFEYIKPLALSKNGSEVLLELDYSKLVWYNLKKKTLRHVNINGLPKSFGTELFSISLLDPGNLIPREKKQSHHNGPEVTRLQLQVTRNCTSSSLLILRGEKLLSLDFQRLDKVVEIDYQSFSFKGSPDIVGSSNGFVCLYKDREFVLWNPWTSKYDRLPNCQLNASGSSHYCFIHGFGYDPDKNDYKVVTILEHHKSLRVGSVHSEVQVYSMKIKSWGKIQKFPYVVCYPSSGVLASGGLHWLARPNPELYSSSNLLIAFDLGSEKCRVVTQPNYVDTDFQMSLGLLSGCLCLLCHYPKQNVDLWVMTDYGTESWTKLFSISQKLIKQFEYLKPLGYSDDGTEVLLEQDNERLLWYNLVRKTVRYLNVHGLPKSFETVMSSASVADAGNLPKTYHEIHEQAPNTSQNSRDNLRGDLDGFLAKGFKLKL